jgi:hypothetical protein
MTPTTTSGVAPAETAAENTANFPANPEVSGMPAKASSSSANAPPTTGERRPRPAHCDRWVASCPPSRTKEMIANAASVEKP